MSERPQNVAVCRGSCQNTYHRFKQTGDGQVELCCHRNQLDSVTPEKLVIWSIEEATVWREPCQQPGCFGDTEQQQSDVWPTAPRGGAGD